MSGQPDHGKSPNGGEEKQEKGKNVAQEVGATTSKGYGKNVSKHAEDNGLWTTPRSMGGKSKLFGIHEIPDSQEEEEEDMGLTLNESEATDEEMEAPAPHWPADKGWAGAMGVLNMSPTPTGEPTQPLSKKRRFDALPKTPTRPRMGGMGPNRTITAGVSALHAAMREIIQQGKEAEAMAMTNQKQIEGVDKAREQGVTSVINRIDAVQSDLGATMARGATIEGMLHRVGTAVEQGAQGTSEQLGGLGATLSGAATEIIWLKTRIEALERAAEQSRLEAGAAKEMSREVLRVLEEMENKRTKEALAETKRREAVEQTTAQSVEVSLVFFGKQIKELAERVDRKEEEIRAVMEEEFKEKEKEFLEMSRQLREATEAADRREIAPPANWADEMQDDTMEIPEISVTPAEAVDIANQITEAVKKAREEQRAQIEASTRELMDGKDREIRKLEQELKAKEIPVPMFPRKTSAKHPKAPAPKESLTESKHAPAASARIEKKEDVVMEEATGQMEVEIVEENSPEARGDSLGPEADDLDFVAEERKPLIRANTTAPTAPRRMRENGPPPPVPPRPAQVQILRRPVTARNEEKEPALPPVPKTTWAQKAAAKPAEDKFALIGKKGKPVKAKNQTDGQKQSPLTPHKGSIPVDQRTIVFTRKGSAGEVTMAQKARITTAINKALFAAAPTSTHIRVEFVRCSPKGTITASAAMGADAKMLMLFRKQILEAANKTEPTIIDVGTNETWKKLKIMGVPYEVFRSADGMKEIASCLEIENALVVPFAPRWLRQQRWLEEQWTQGRLRFAPVVITVRGPEIAKNMIAKGLSVCGVRLKVEPYVEEGKDAQCDKCAAWGHSEFRCPLLGMLRCGLCGEKHRTSAHTCLVAGCGKKGVCKHLQPKCANCGGKHTATWTRCPFARSARSARGSSPPPPPQTTEPEKDKGKGKEEEVAEPADSDTKVPVTVFCGADWSEHATPATASNSATPMMQ